MKKLLPLLAAFAAVSVQAALPLEKTVEHVSTPLELGHDEYHFLYGPEYGVHGLRLNSFYVENRYMHGVDLGFWNESEDAGGFQLALYRAETHDFGGIQIAGWSVETKHVGGFQFATVQSDAEDVYGVQLTGLLGRARAVSGVQIAGVTAASDSREDKVRAKGLQAALYETRAEKLGGLQIGGVFCDVGRDARGIQAAALFSKARTVHGLQLGGLAARSKESSGLQLSGLYSRSELDARGLLQASGILADAGELKGGLQIGGVAANVHGRADGLQIGGLTTMAATLNGTAVAAGWNYVFEELNGVQIGGYNHARRVRGVQIGLINHCSRLEGVQIGLINTVKESRFSTSPLMRVDF